MIISNQIKFVSVVIPERKWQYVFLGVYDKTSLPLYHHQTKKDSKFTSNFTDIYSSNLYICHMSNLMLPYTIAL